jgi:hypothetical protein
VQWLFFVILKFHLFILWVPIYGAVVVVDDDNDYVVDDDEAAAAVIVVVVVVVVVRLTGPGMA